MGETVQYPFRKYYEIVLSGRAPDIFSTTYLKYWVIFAIAAVILYYMIAKGIFTSQARAGARVVFASNCAIVAGLFAVVVSFYLVFMFSPVQHLAWGLEFTLLLAWFLFFVFSWVTSPAPR